MGHHRAERPGREAAAESTGRRRAPSRRALRRWSLSRTLFSPVFAGVVVVAGAAGASVLDARPPTNRDWENAAAGSRVIRPAGALSGSAGVATVRAPTTRTAIVSRGGVRTGTNPADAGLQGKAERQAAARGAALRRLADDAQAYAVELRLNRWVLPLSYVNITAEFGEYGLWSSYHTGLDFNADTGDPIRAIAGGLVTSASYDGAYGNKTVVTLDDGTELWYCHQDAFAVSTGETVRAGELIGYVGSTGNVTGSHLHVEVRPGAGDPVDPRAAFAVEGLFF
ncbi:MAG: M23 family metallopeptidase [Propionibacteriaceae bacterium]